MISLLNTDICFPLPCQLLPININEFSTILLPRRILNDTKQKRSSLFRRNRQSVLNGRQRTSRIHHSVRTSCIRSLAPARRMFAPHKSTHTYPYLQFRVREGSRLRKRIVSFCRKAIIKKSRHTNPIVLKVNLPGDIVYGNLACAIARVSGRKGYEGRQARSSRGYGNEPRRRSTRFKQRVDGLEENKYPSDVHLIEK